MTSYIAADLRRIVEVRAMHVCEYCLVHADDTYLGCQVDHIIAEKHRGPTWAGNLSHACTFCNRAKGTDIASVSEMSGEIVRLYNPRTDIWDDHFVLDGAVIRSKSDIGAATSALLSFNAPERILERESMATIGRYPSIEAQQYSLSQRSS